MSVGISQVQIGNAERIGKARRIGNLKAVRDPLVVCTHAEKTRDETAVRSMALSRCGKGTVHQDFCFHRLFSEKLLRHPSNPHCTRCMRTRRTDHHRAQNIE